MTVHLCDEIHVFESIAEKTGLTVDLGGCRAEPRVCTTVGDLVRKHRRFGDGHFYLRAGEWPEGVTSVPVQQLKSRKKPVVA